MCVTDTTCHIVLPVDNIIIFCLEKELRDDRDGRSFHHHPPCYLAPELILLDLP